MDSSSKKDKKHRKRSVSREREKERERDHHKSSKKRRNEDENTNEKPAQAEKLELSIDETNKLRAQLGLKPLQVDTNEQQKKKDGGEADSVSSQGNKIYHDTKTDETFEHVPARNINDTKDETKIREKLNLQKEKHKLHEKFLSTKTLGDDDSDNEVDNTQNWVQKLKDKQRLDAEKKAKLLQEMDEEAVREDDAYVKPKKSLQNYTSKDLTGLRVEHQQKYFSEGSDVILTLKDKYVLDDNDEDVLVNVNLLDQESADKNNENKKKKPTYKPFDEFDEDGTFKEKNILDKYDDDIDGEKKRSFRLGAGGTYDGNMDRFIEEQNNEMKSRAVKLDINDFKIANDYLTKDEQEAFKKPKKIRKKLRKTVKADDLVPLDEVEEVKKDESTSKKVVRQERHEAKPTSTTTTATGVTLKNIDFNFRSRDEDSDDDDENGNYGGAEDFSLNDDSAYDELHKALTKIRSKAVVSSKINEIADRIIEERELEESAVKAEPIDEDDERVQDNVTLDTMSEFCRNVGSSSSSRPRRTVYNDVNEDEEIVSYKNEMAIKKERVGQEDEEEEEGEADEMDYEEDDEEMEKKKATAATSGAEPNAILDDEPIIDSGLASAIRLATNKGYLELDKKNMNARIKENISAVHIMVEEKNNYDIDDKYTRGRDRYNGPTSEFKEKDSYKPDIKLEYVDETGHRMNQKEAFRYLSHRFHGKGPGKLKTEKRTNKNKELDLMNKMSSTDTPLNTVALLIEKQKKLQQPYVVLSAPKGGKHDQIPLHKP